MAKVWWIYPKVRTGLHSVKPHRRMKRGNGVFMMRRGRWFLALQFKCWKGICVVARWPVGAGLFPHPADVERWEFPDMKKKTGAATAADVAHLAAAETILFSDLLPLVEHCIMRRYEDGDPREPGWFTVKTTGAAWVLQVKDPDSAMSFSSVAESLDKVLQTAALLLACDEAPWEPDPWLMAAKQKKSKK
jgi:hypothetical protein